MSALWPDSSTHIISCHPTIGTLPALLRGLDTLETVLSELAVGRLVVVGAQTDMCVRSTLHGALVRGYDATLVSDAHTTEDLSDWGAPPPELVIAHTNLYWGEQSAPGRTAVLRPVRIRGAAAAARDRHRYGTKKRNRGRVRWSPRS